VSLCHGMLEDDQVMLEPSTMRAAELIEVIIGTDGKLRFERPLGRR
jgi:hypothetical protein